MKCQSIFSGKNKHCNILKFLPNTHLSINHFESSIAQTEGIEICKVTFFAQYMKLHLVLKPLSYLAVVVETVMQISR